MTKLEFIAGLMDEVRQTNKHYAQIQKVGVQVYPIPYFGDLERATVATVGVNPSATEFQSERWHNGVSNAADLEAIISRYFRGTAHKWFATWEESLNTLGHSYKRDAVHLDLSPRATKAMGSADAKMFLNMIQMDIKWLFDILDFCPKLNLILMAGCVTNKYYIDEFVKKNLRDNYTFEIKNTFEQRKRGASAMYELTGPTRKLRVFFCSSSPSSRDRGHRLKGEIARNAASISAKC